MVCPGESFCCRPGTTCSRDAAGTATCLDSTGGTIAPNSNTGLVSVVTYTATATLGGSNNNGNINNSNINNTDNSVNNSNNSNTDKSTNNSNNGNINNTNQNSNIVNGDSVPQATVASGLMVTVVFLTAFLVSPLSFSHKIRPDQDSTQL